MELRFIQILILQGTLTQDLAMGPAEDEHTNQLMRIIEATGLDKFRLSGVTPNHSGMTSNIGGIAADLGKVLGLSQLLFDPLAATEHRLDFGLLDGVSLGRSLTAVSPYASLLFSTVAPYLKACASLLFTLISVIGLTVGFQ